MAGHTADAVAELNDQFRARLGRTAEEPRVEGHLVLTRAVAALPAQVLHGVIEAVRGYDSFAGGNDPYDEHDFASMEIIGTGTVFWKFEYYADSSCTFGTEHPGDPKRSYRVLTVMLPEEY